MVRETSVQKARELLQATHRKLSDSTKMETYVSVQNDQGLIARMETKSARNRRKPREGEESGWHMLSPSSVVGITWSFLKNAGSHYPSHQLKELGTVSPISQRRKQSLRKTKGGIRVSQPTSSTIWTYEDSGLTFLASKLEKMWKKAKPICGRSLYFWPNCSELSGVLNTFPWYRYITFFLPFFFSVYFTLNCYNVSGGTMMAEKKTKLSSGQFIILGTPMQIYKTYSKPNLPYLLLNQFLYAFPSSFYYQLINISIKITTYSLLTTRTRCLPIWLLLGLFRYLLEWVIL